MTKKFDARNAEKSRAVCGAMAERADTGKRIMSEREKLILDMWPKFEDGEYVWFGDAYVDGSGDANKVKGVRFNDRHVFLVGIDDFLTVFNIVEYAKRPAPKALDADGVEIKVGDTVWFRSLSTGDRIRKATVAGFGEHSLGLDGPLATLKDEVGRTWHIDPKKITRVQPDSWERLEEDASKDACVYFGGTGHFDCSECSSGGVNCFRRMKLDIIRRAKALAGVEARR